MDIKTLCLSVSFLFHLSSLYWIAFITHCLYQHCVGKYQLPIWHSNILLHSEHYLFVHFYKLFRKLVMNCFLRAIFCFFYLYPNVGQFFYFIEVLSKFYIDLWKYRHHNPAYDKASTFLWTLHVMQICVRCKHKYFNSAKKIIYIFQWFAKLVMDVTLTPSFRTFTCQ